MSDNISFLIALQIDSQDRLDNLDISVSHLQYHFPNAEIILSEIDSESKLSDRYSNCSHIFTKDSNFFSKTKAYNIAAKNSNKNNVLCLYDADVVLKKEIINKCSNIIQEKITDIVYPYNGYFYDVPKYYHQDIKINKNLDIVDLKDCRLLSHCSVGAAVFFNRNVFFEGGGANENIKIGYEDNEFYERFKKLGYKIGRINAPLYHLTHIRKETSFDYNPYKNEFQKEFIRICEMSKQDLLNEVNKWTYEKKGIYQ